MDRHRKRTIRRSGTEQGAKFVYALIIRHMGRSIKAQKLLPIEMPIYLTTIPEVEFATLMRHINGLKECSAPVKELILAEAARRAETILLS